MKMLQITRVRRSYKSIISNETICYYSFPTQLMGVTAGVSVYITTRLVYATSLWFSKYTHILLLALVKIKSRVSTHTKLVTCEYPH